MNIHPFSALPFPSKKKHSFSFLDTPSFYITQGTKQGEKKKNEVLTISFSALGLGTKTAVNHSGESAIKSFV